MGIDVKKIKKAYGIDQEKAVSGVWFQLTSIDGAQVLVAKVGNPNYEKMLRRLYKPHSRALRKGKELAQSIQDEISTTLLVKTILLDWKGFPDENGEDVPYSEGEARKLFNDPELKELKEEIMDFADDHAKFALEMDEELEKNSEIT